MNLSTKTQICLFFVLMMSLGIINNNIYNLRDLPTNKLFEQTAAIAEGNSGGSGVLFKNTEKYSYFLTNAHVCLKCKNPEVALINSKIKIGKIVAMDFKYDLCIIKTELYNKDPVLISNNSVKIGKKIHNFSHNVDMLFYRTEGYASIQYKNTQFRIASLKVNFGSSGSGIFNDNGKLVGLVSKKNKKDFVLFIDIQIIKNFIKGRKYE